MSFPTEDRVSALPDSILSHILSFLPTKSSAATSILSKRWNPLWLSVLDLNFDGQSFKDFITFRHVVSSVMLSREVTLPIQSFCLRYFHDDGYDDNDMNRFINAVLKRGIENLDLHFSTKINQLKLTSNIFSCKTLTILKLKNLDVNDLPASQLHFPSLKILIMNGVYFTCFEDIIKFLLACPILEDLQTGLILHLRYWNDFSYAKRGLDIIKGKCLPNLIRARISENISIPLTLLSSVHTLNVQLRFPCLPPPYIAHTFHNLTQMELFFFKYNGNIWTGKWMWMQQALQHSSKLQHLTIHQEIEDGVNEAYWEDPQIVTQCLSSQLKTFSFRGCRGKNSELQFVEYIMQNSKVLRTMTIHTASSIDLKAKHQMLIKLTVCPRNHKLIFD